MVFWRYSFQKNEVFQKIEFISGLAGNLSERLKPFCNSLVKVTKYQ